MEEYRNSKKKTDIFTEKQEVYVVTAKLKPGQVTANKRTNKVKIIGEIVRDKVEPDDIKYNGFTSTDLIFKKMVEANKCLSIKDNSKRTIIYTIVGRTTQCKGVITTWDGSLEELTEAIDRKEMIVNLERLRKKEWNAEGNTFQWKETKHVVVTMKGNEIPEEIAIWNGITGLRVRPFVETVVQCVQCFNYGHWKDVCKKEKKMSNLWTKVSRKM